MQKLAAAALVALAVCGAWEFARLDEWLPGRSAHDRYISSLRRAGLDATPLGSAWISASHEALDTARTVKVPSRHTESIRQDSPAAIAHRIELQRGRVYQLSVDVDSSAPLNVFIDLFHSSDTQRRERAIAAGPLTRRLAFEAYEDETLIVRIHPELLGQGHLVITHSTRAALLFPVPERGRRDIHSLFGASRDRGRREHQGIDIFAPRGTPVVAASDGWISSTTPNQLGGNVVWLWDPRRRQTLYYAHLDRVAVTAGTRVKKGDVLGFVGNTGNARTTKPHLHFGIYRRGEGAINPLDYVVDPPA